ncbi:restriction endonuclease subunit S [Pectobacterium parmentieri]|uniref:restriction endonuclease subunit S n=1 Tax=Pectobacterium parmentieri TaxID=1905730 RepID=UPI00192A1F21|nr:restriction endonuclease subunit S [Pectobacterium parmentieri]
MINIAEMPKYQTYKDSTEGWIGDVPEHWDIRKLKHLFYEKKHRPNMSLNSGAISFGKVVTKDDEKILLSTKASYQEVLSGEFLINPLNLNYDLISLRIALSEIDVVVSAGYIVIKEKEELQKQYFKYLLHRYDVAYMKLLGSGVRQTISFNHIANSLLVFPPLEEQSLIANYLEKKTAQVDEAIAIKEQQISLLKERKQIIIQQAVTQGLDPNVPMKDSGVDWIGKVPAHWEVRRSKFVFTAICNLGLNSNLRLQIA